MKYTYIPQGVCSTKVDFEIEDGVVKNVSFLGGCNGNLKAISALVEGMPVDQLATALKKAVEKSSEGAGSESQQ